MNLFSKKFGISKEEARYFISSGSVSSNTYTEEDDNINILYNDGTIKDISIASDMLNISVISKEVKKHYYCFLKVQD